MTKQQVWQTIALDLKRAGNYVLQNRNNRADYYFDEARTLYFNEKGEVPEKLRRVHEFIDQVFSANETNNPEDLILASGLIAMRVS